MRVQIKVTTKNREALERIKQKCKHKSLNQTVTLLIKGYSTGEAILEEIRSTT